MDVDDAARFGGSIADAYDELLVPLIFAPYAAILSERVVARRPSRVLEVAAGTGAVTRELSRALGPDVGLVATDLSPAMLVRAEAVGTPHPVSWSVADAVSLPFPDSSFDAVVCQFGVMFVPDRVRAYSEARRVLRPGGMLLFDAWDRLEANPFAHTVETALATRYPDRPIDFLARLPHGYADPEVIRAEVIAAGFAADAVQVDAVDAQSRAESAGAVAMAFCLGTPEREEVLARDPRGLDAATADAEVALRRRFGDGVVQAGLRAWVVQATA